MNKTIFVLGMLVVFAFTPFNVEIAKADADISGQCVTSTVGAFVTITPRDVCQRAGYYDCVSASGTYSLYSNNACGAFFLLCAFNPIASCDFPYSCGAVSNSISITNLICEDIRPWGIVPRPGNVPSDFNQTILNLTNWILGFIY